MTARQAFYHCKNCGKHIPAQGVYCKFCGLPLGSSFREETGERRRGRTTMVLTGSHRFSVESRVAESDRATLDLARDLRLGRQVLLRRPGKDVLASQEGLSLFLRAMRNSSRLRHPCIAVVFEEGSDELGPYGVLEYVEGQALTERLSEKARLSLREVLRLGVDLADALVHAHEQGVVHGNLSPQRVLIDLQGRPRLTSFGRVEVPELPLRATVFDAPDLQPLRPTFADDIYSFGMLMRTCLLGEPGSATDASIPVSLRQVLTAAMAARAHERWRSMSELRDALAAVGGRRLQSRDGRCPECGALDLRDHPFCGQCGSDLRDLFRTCDTCNHTQHQRHHVCGNCGSRLEDQGRLALEQAFLGLLAGSWDSASRELQRLRRLNPDLEAVDVEHGSRVLGDVFQRLESDWRQGRWDAVRLGLPLVGQLHRSLGLPETPSWQRLKEVVERVSRHLAEVEDAARERRLTAALDGLRRCLSVAGGLPPSATELLRWTETMTGWFEERLTESARLAGSGSTKAARDHLEAALREVHPNDPLAIRASAALGRLLPAEVAS